MGGPIIAAQVRQEAEWLLRKMRDYNFGGSLLEIGSHAGGFLALMAYNCRPGSRLRAIDMTAAYGLEDVIRRLKDDGYDAECFIGDSKSADAVYWANKQGPYDFIFIDGDHTYMGVESDWKNYKHLARWIGFHDIRDRQWGTVELWDELRGKYPSMEYSHKPDAFGIGLLKMPEYGETYVHSCAAEIKFSA